MDGLSAQRLPRAHVLREAPVHALMVAVMVPTMLWPSAMLSLAGAGVLIVAAAICARLSHSRRYLLEHIVDLCAMALLLVALVPGEAAGAGHGHSSGMPGTVAVGVLLSGWGAARFALLRRVPASALGAPLTSTALTGTGLLLMVALCA